MYAQGVVRIKFVCRSTYIGVARRLFTSCTMAKSKYEYVRSYEQDVRVAVNNFIVLRVDGRSFHGFSDKYGFEKPNDDRALQLMTCAAQTVMRSFRDIVLAYGESDEYSFIFRRQTDIFDRRLSKLISIVPSLFSSAYTLNWPSFFKGIELKPSDAPSFDARATPYPLEQEIHDYLSWRQEDCHINNLNNTCIWKLVQLKGLTTSEAQQRINTLSKGDKNELLFSEFNTNYNNLPAMYRKGTVLVWDMTEKQTTEKMSASNMDETGDSSTGTNQPQHSSTSKAHRTLTALHVDMNEAFWSQRPHLLSGTK